MNMGLAPNPSSVKNFILDSTQSGILTRNLQAFSGGPLDPSKTMQNTSQHLRSDGTMHSKIDSNMFGQIDTLSSTPLVSRTEKVVDEFLQSSVFKNEADVELNEAVCMANHVHCISFFLIFYCSLF